MASMWIWKALPTRRTSPSGSAGIDCLTSLLSSEVLAGHDIRLIDWERDDFYRGLTPPFLSGAAWFLANLVVTRKQGKRICPTTRLLQRLMSFVQKRRMKLALRKLALEVAAGGSGIFCVKVRAGESYLWANYLAEQIRMIAPEIVLLAGVEDSTIELEQFLKHGKFDAVLSLDNDAALGRILKLADQAAGSGSDGLLSLMRDAVNAGWLTDVACREGDMICMAPRTGGPEHQSRLPAKVDLSGRLLLHTLQLSASWSVESVLSEIRILRNSGIGLIRFSGREISAEKGAALARGLQEGGLNLEYAVDLNVPEGAQDNAGAAGQAKGLSEMIRAGLRAVSIRDAGQPLDDLKRTLDALRAAARSCGRHVDVSLVAQHSGEWSAGQNQSAWLDRGLLLARLLRPDSVVVLHPVKLSDVLEYEFVPYRPFELWPASGKGLDGLKFAGIIGDCAALKGRVEELGIPADLTVNDFLMLRSCGYEGMKGANKFKRQTMADIVSCHGRRLEQLRARTNARSLALASGFSVQSGEAAEVTGMTAFIEKIIGTRYQDPEYVSPGGQGLARV